MLQDLPLRHLDEQLAPWRELPYARPRRGWLRAIRRPEYKQGWFGDLLDMIAQCVPYVLGILFLMWICGPRLT